MSSGMSPRDTAERFALSAALRYPDLAEEAGLTARDFTSGDLGLAWEALERVPFRDEAGRLPVAHLAAESGVAVEALAEALRCAIFAPDQARHWWARLRDLSTSERLAAELVALARKQAPGDDRTGSLLAELEQVTRRYSGEEVEREVRTLADLAADYVAERSAELRLGRRVGVVTGLRAIDDWMGGLNPGELSTLAAAGGAGKSTFVLDIARRVADQGGTVLVFAAEMTARQIGQREVHGELGRPVSDRLVGAVDLAEALARIQGTEYAGRVVVDTRTRLAATQVLATARRVQAQRGLALLVFDHLGHWDPKVRGNEQEQLAAAIVQAKDLAKILDVPFVMLCHFSRARREATRPTMEIIRGTGKIDDVSDNIFALWRPDLERTELHLLKCRQTGQQNRAMRLSYSLFRQQFSEEEEIFFGSSAPPPARAHRPREAAEAPF
ncbi:MAG: Replicative DNA helicase [Acidobacteria bacterium ADurb.Bin051]|jgi:hypothetical protein|nr:MAG: Replicative DNA helicase [Acidobacteria bacterium ADurb.Bin051]